MTPASWTILPPVGLRGVGTNLVESPEHYLARLSQACGTSPHKLAEQIWIASGRPTVKGRDPRRAWTLLPESAFMETVGRMTGQHDLECGTLLTFRHILSDGWTGGSRLRRWCPVCFLDWQENSSWEPLAWMVPFLTRCPVHETRLESNCLRCGARQRSRRSYRLRRKCAACRSPLGWHVKPDSMTHIERWVDGVVLDFVSMCADPDIRPIPYARVNELLRYVANDQTFRPRHFATFSRRLRLECRGRLTLVTLVNLCALLGMRPRDLLLAPVEAFSPRLFEDWSEFIELPLRYSKRAVEMKRAARVLERLSSNCRQPLLPLQSVLAEFDLLDGLLGDAFSPAIAAYTKAFKAQSQPPDSTLFYRTVKTALHLTRGGVASSNQADANSLASRLSTLHGGSPALARWALRGARHLYKVIAKVDQEDRLDALRKHAG